MTQTFQAHKAWKVFNIKKGNPVKILQRQIQQAEFARTVWVVKPEPGVTLDQMLQPESWAHVSKSLKPGDLIDVLPPDNEWYAELFVRSSGDNEAKLVVLKHYSFADVKQIDSEVEVKHRGEAKKWSVLRKSDKAVLVEGLETRGAAEDWVKANRNLG